MPDPECPHIIRLMATKSDSTEGLPDAPEASRVPDHVRAIGPSSVERISATEASRSFSTLLDEVEKGRRFIVNRHGRDVCEIGPPPVTGRRAGECLELLRARPSVLLDGTFADDLLEVLADERVEERPPWDS